jgi:signal transduction histidine kinase
MNSLSTLLHLQTHNNIDQSELTSYLPKLSDQFESVTFLLYSLVRWSRSQIDGFKLDKVKLNVADLIDKKLKLFQFLLLDKRLEWKLSIDQSLHIVADEEMMLIAIQNLLSNAIKFAQEGTSVHVRVYTNESQKIVISVMNQGEPVPEYLIPKLFTYDMPVSTDTRGERGTGLGLALTAFFVNLNGGVIHLVPAERGATIFSIEIPQAVS